MRRFIFGTPAWLSLAAIRLVEPLLRDIVLTEEELLGLRQELLLSHAPPSGKESIEKWLMANGHALGRCYINDIDRHFGAGSAAAILRPD